MTIRVVLVEPELGRRDELAEALLRHGVGGVEVAGTLHEAESVREAVRGHGDIPVIADVRDPRADHPVTACAEGTLRVLGELLDAAVPLHASTSAEIGRLAGGLADRFGVPALLQRELLQAVRVQALASLMVGQATPALGMPATLPTVTRASARLLRGIPGLEGIADLIDAAGANWDGSGNPPLQRGEIPLRTRMLRVATDAVSVARRLGRGTPLAAVHQHLALRAGTWYDPAVLAALQAIAALEPEGALHGRRVEEIPLEALRVGMVLAADLTTASGTTLMRAGQLLSAHALDVIRARHESDPITGALLIQPDA